jgi:hypothetical protein
MPHLPDSIRGDFAGVPKDNRNLQLALKLIF